MVGWLVRKEEKGRKPLLELERVLGVPLLRVLVPTPSGCSARALLRRMDRAAELLWRNGCRRVLTDPCFPYWDRLTERGLRPVDTAPICQNLAAPLVLSALTRAGIPPERACVALRGARVSRPLFQAAEALCPKVRRLVISAPAGGEDLARFLRNEYGIPVLEEGAGCATDVAAEFSFLEGGCGAAYFHLYGPVPDLVGFSLRSMIQPLPEEVQGIQLLALLWEEGALPLEEIEIVPINRGEFDLTERDKLHIIS